MKLIFEGNLFLLLYQNSLKNRLNLLISYIGYHMKPMLTLTSYGIMCHTFYEKTGLFSI